MQLIWEAGARAGDPHGPGSARLLLVNRVFFIIDENGWSISSLSWRWNLCISITKDFSSLVSSNMISSTYGWNGRMQTQQVAVVVKELLQSRGERASPLPQGGGWVRKTTCNTHSTQPRYSKKLLMRTNGDQKVQICLIQYHTIYFCKCQFNGAFFVQDTFYNLRHCDPRSGWSCLRASPSCDF